LYFTSTTLGLLRQLVTSLHLWYKHIQGKIFACFTSTKSQGLGIVMVELQSFLPLQ